MKPLWQHIITCTCALLVVAYLVFGLKMSTQQTARPVCKKLEVRILDEDQRQYISQDDVKKLIQRQSLDPVGKNHNPNTLQRIEELVRKHDMVRTAECYYTQQGNVCVVLTQRVPVVRIYTGTDTYFIDQDRKVMPAYSTVTTPVLQVYGEVGKNMATHEITDFALWLKKNSYWQQRVSKVQVVSPKMVHLLQQNERATIVIGDWRQYDAKLSKLRRWYEVEQQLNLAQYPMVDVRYHGQVIGIK